MISTKPSRAGNTEQSVDAGSFQIVGTAESLSKKVPGDRELYSPLDGGGGAVSVIPVMRGLVDR